MTEERWSWIERELRRDPPVDPASIDRVMRQVRAVEPRTPAWASFMRWVVRPRAVMLSPMHAAGALAVAAIAIVISMAALGHPSPDGASRAAAVRPSGLARRDVQFLLVAPDAKRVSVVGDFNDWNPDAVQLRRTAAGVWSAVVALTPGRHVYSFVIDGSKWVPDASAPRAPEDEYGQSNSVAFVESGS